MDDKGGSERRSDSADVDGVDTPAVQSGGTTAATLMQPFLAVRSGAVARLRSTGGRRISSDSGAQNPLLESLADIQSLLLCGPVTNPNPSAGQPQLLLFMCAFCPHPNHSMEIAFLKTLHEYMRVFNAGGAESIGSISQNTASTDGSATCESNGLATQQRSCPCSANDDDVGGNKEGIDTDGCATGGGSASQDSSKRTASSGNGAASEQAPTELNQRDGPAQVQTPTSLIQPARVRVCVGLLNSAYFLADARGRRNLRKMAYTSTGSELYLLRAVPRHACAIICLVRDVNLTMSTQKQLPAAGRAHAGHSPCG